MTSAQFSPVNTSSSTSRDEDIVPGRKTEGLFTDFTPITLLFLAYTKYYPVPLNISITAN